VGVADLLDAARLIGRYPRTVVLCGVVPQSIELGVGLTPPVDAALPALVAAVADECRRLGHELEAAGAAVHGRRLEVRGVVQGVGFRPWVYRVARELGLTGSVWNHAAGVTIDAFGAEDALDALVARLRDGGPPAAVVRDLAWAPLTRPGGAPANFTIEASDPAGERRLSVPADLATCEACVAELFDPTSRRHRYPFINCTDCGPRDTIVRGMPYDRQRTTMAGFAMCPACRIEYETPGNRRFHAEPNACPACGPRLVAVGPDGRELDGEPVRLAAQALTGGGIVALKGLGGYHLACDAGNADAVARLRARKRREGKPFAIMVRDLAAAGRIAEVAPEAARLLCSAQRPIVLVPRAPGAAVANQVSDTALLGVMLPYTPLHHLLLAAVARPLVMTSGNLSDEPIAYRDDDALARLGPVADLLLVHDRPIEARSDDSVTRVVAGRPLLVRRARGWVPSPIQAPRRVARPVLAAGGDLKNTFAIAVGDAVHLGPHVGDLDRLACVEALDAGVARLERLLGVRPEVVAHDLHPGYVSSEWARRRPEPVKIAVQHHHAHVAAAMADAHVDGPVLGLAWDGTGWGTDGTAWGGELLLADWAGYTRVGTFRPVALPGGDLAVRLPWRAALAALVDAYDGVPPLRRLPLFGAVPGRELDLVRQMLAAGLQSPRARGIGRWFDVFAAIGLGLGRAAYEGQLAVRWELAADPRVRTGYPFALDTDAERLPWEVDLRPTLRAAVDDLSAGQTPGTVAARFHNTLVAAGVALLRAAIDRFGRHPVVLTGGCFQNARLTEGMAHAAGLHAPVLLQGRVPPGDGGLALGQALIADAQLRARSTSCV
jgi:hydrogenase maturation protein HypF